MIDCHRSHCTGVLPSRAVSSCQPRVMFGPSTDVLKYNRGISRGGGGLEEEIVRDG